MTSIVVPAHNEEKGVARLLRALGFPGAVPYQVIVVANGCSDATAAVARELGATVIETPVPSKTKAMALGDSCAQSFPRIYVDGDVVIRSKDVDALCASLTGGVHAAGPERVLPMAGVAPAVRWYYDIWRRLDGVKCELYGRGVVAVDEYGHSRLRGWPDVVSDDMFIAMAFAPSERTVAHNAEVVIFPPKTYRDLLRRRVRVITGNARLEKELPRGTMRPSGGSLSRMLHVSMRSPALIPKVTIFVGTTLAARLASRVVLKQGHTEWLRDESSRI